MMLGPRRPANRLSGIRRSHLVGTFGPGAIIDTLPEQHLQSGVSGVVAGLAEWDLAAGELRRGLNHHQLVHEPRLQDHLGVRGFRSPPIISDDEMDEPHAADVLPIVRFPHWMVCPICEALRPFDQFNEFRVGHPVRVCRRRRCDNVPVNPVRFVFACENGHLDDFQWQRWAGCVCENPDLRLTARGAGVGGLYVGCERCENQRSLEQAFMPQNLREAGIHCSGARPWSSQGSEMGCRSIPRLLQRGSSSIYFPDIVSMISIPPFTDRISQLLGPDHTSSILALRDRATSPAEFREELDGWMRFTDLSRIPAEPDAIHRQLLLWYDILSRGSDDYPEGWEEFRRLMEGLEQHTEDHNFEVRPGELDPSLAPLFEGIVLGPKLREVRALRGFSRVNPSQGLLLPVGMGGSVQLADEVDREWLPAVEINGEGLFLALNEERIRAWEESANVIERIQTLRDRMQDQLREEETLERVTPRLMLLHSLSHALMRRLTLSSGYSSASLKERIYSSDEDPYWMAGILISTGAPDSEGTLGGLVRQGRRDLFHGVVTEMIEEMTWCSSDPVCIDGTISLSTPLNGAACHACMLAPETSCEHQNLALDRALLVGTPEDRGLGFLHPLMSGEIEGDDA